MKKLIFIILFLLGCSPERLLQMAVQKGAKVKVDTVFQQIITEKTLTDTVVHFQTVNRIIGGDTVTIETTRWKSKTVIDTLFKTVFQQVECKPDTVKVPVTVTTTISAGYTKFQLIGSILAVLIIVGLVGYVIIKTKT